MDIYIYIVLLHHIICASLSIICLKWLLPVFYNYAKNSNNNTKQQLSSIITQFFIYIIFTSFSSLIYRGYSMFWWRPAENIYDERILFWLAFIPFSCQYIGYVLEIALCVDRCITVQYPVQYTKRNRRLFGYISFCAVVIVMAAYLYFGPILPGAIPKKSETFCAAFGCLIRMIDLTSLINATYVIQGINVFFGLLLLLLVKKKIVSADANKRINRTVLTIIFCQTFFDIVPNNISTIILNTWNIEIIDIIGPWGATVLIINMTICAFFYSRAFRESSRTNRIVSISAQNSNQR